MAVQAEFVLERGLHVHLTDDTHLFADQRRAQGLRGSGDGLVDFNDEGVMGIHGGQEGVRD